MNRESALAVTRRLIEHVVADTTDLAEAPWVEPAENYFDPEVWEREREQFFFESPLAIGFAGEIAKPGTFFTTEVMGKPVVVTRDKEGALRAFLNVCTHRGARVAEGCGKAARLVCRFHGWNYELDGRLAGRGRSQDFEPVPLQTGLQQLPVSDRGGVIMLGVRPEMGQLRVEHALDDILPAFEGYEFAKMQLVGSDRFEVDANWKLVTNLSHEGYHFATLHRDSLAPMMTGHGAVDEFGLHTRWAFPFRGIENLRDKDEAEWPSYPNAAVNHTLFPGTVIVANEGNAQMIRVEPGDEPGKSVVYFSSVAVPSVDGEVSDADRGTYEFGRNIFESEDLPAAAECQHGIAAREQPVVIGRNEMVVQMWHRRWRDKLD
ncbi:MAG: aromatic ring-hydroxylating dioxygenase subunit alpha [Proteobacteria bacterium]|nr:aromatic ring-hydroxylating dioxygenase subunit alpha [Pseudomonadota bacterium]